VLLALLLLLLLWIVMADNGGVDNDDPIRTCDNAFCQ